MGVRVPVRATTRGRHERARRPVADRRPRLSPVQHRVLELQQTAGNAAVVTLLQRDVTPDPEPATPADRLKTALPQATAEWITTQTATAYAAAPDGGMPAWTAALRTALGVGDVAAPGKRDRWGREWNTLDGALTKGITKALVERFKGQTDTIAAQGVATSARTLLDASPLGSGALTDKVWVSALGNGKITVLPYAAQEEATKQWKALQDRLTSVQSTWVGEASAATTPEMLTAAKGAVRATPTWINTPAEITAFTNQVAGAMASADAKATVRAHGVALLALAETAIVKEDMAGVSFVDKLTAEQWLASGRGFYQSILTEPLWVYFANRVKGISFLGFDPGKQAGLNADLEPMLRAVEASMVAKKGATAVADLGVQKMFGIRFQTSGPPEHAKARAIDLSPAWKNPMVKEEHLTLASVLSGSWLHKINAALSGPKRSALLTRIRPIVDEQQSLRAQLKAGGGDRAAITARLAQLDTDLAAVHSSTDVADYVTRSLDAKAQLEAVQAAVASSWAEVTADEADAATIKTRVMAKIDAALLTAKQDADAAKLALKSIADQKKETTDTAKKTELDRQAATHRQTLTESTDHSTRLTKLKAALGARGAAASFLGTDRKSDSNPTMAQVAAHGLIDMPDWFLAGFIENGWTWGGAGWGEGSGRDTMHFEYLGPLGGVRS